MRDHLANFEAALGQMRATQGEQGLVLASVQQGQADQAKFVDDLKTLHAQNVKDMKEGFQAQLTLQETRLKLEAQTELQKVKDQHATEAQRWQKCNSDFAVLWLVLCPQGFEQMRLFCCSGKGFALQKCCAL